MLLIDAVPFYINTVFYVLVLIFGTTRYLKSKNDSLRFRCLKMLYNVNVASFDVLIAIEIPICHYPILYG